MTKRLESSDIKKSLKKIPGWTKKGNEISKLYTFSGFIAAIAFVNHVAGQAEGMDHHPDILIQYKKVRLSVSTHSAGGLTDLDFTLAQKIDA